MQFLNRHILVLGRLFLVIFIVATSGFSVVMTYCTMSDGGACPMASGNDDDQDWSGTCADHTSQQGATHAALSNNYACMLTTVAGGLQTDPTTIEKVSHRQELTKLVVLPAAVPLQMSSLILDRPFSHYSSAGPNVSPPSVEKYVLNATFLI